MNLTISLSCAMALASCGSLVIFSEFASTLISAIPEFSLSLLLVFCGDDLLSTTSFDVVLLDFPESGAIQKIKREKMKIFG